MSHLPYYDDGYISKLEKRLEWLQNEHRSLDEEVSAIEKLRDKDRSAELKALLISLKAKKLSLKTEIFQLSSEVNEYEQKL